VRWPLREEELPRGYRLTRSHGGVLAFDSLVGARLESGGFGPEGGERLEASEFSGRRPLQVLHGGPRGERYVVRAFHHGGVFRWLGSSFYFDPRRPFHELALAEKLEGLGIKTPRVVAARARRAGAMGWRLDLVTRAVEHSMDGAQALERLRRGELDDGQRRVLFRGAGALVGDLHRVGFQHRDLHPRNLLFDVYLKAEEESWVLDLDGSHFVSGELSDTLRRKNLSRMWRWVRRKQERLGAFCRQGDVARFMRAYEAVRGKSSPAWRMDWRGVEQMDRRGRLLHRSGWLLEGCLGVGHERHDGVPERRPQA